MKRTIELTDEFIDKLVIDKLTEDFERTTNEVRQLEAWGELQEYQRADLKASRKIRKAAKRMLKYYGVAV